MYKYNAVLVRVVDGDTIKANIDLGFDTWVFKTIRLAEINAPESRTRNLVEKKKGLAAKDRLIEILEAEESFILESHMVGKYGRCIGTIYINDTNVNEQLVEEGHAVPAHY